MEQRHRETIGRIAMLVMAIGLLTSSVWLFRAGWKLGRAEAAERAEVQRMSRTGRSTGYGACLVVGAAGLGLSGLYFLKLGLLSHRRLDENPPKAPVLWDNREPGARYWRGPQ